MSTRLVPQADLTAFGHRLARYRMARDWSAEEVGRRIGCSGRSVLQWEDGERVPGADWLAALARVFRVSMDELWRGPTS